jgi:hypothetical protein
MSVKSFYFGVCAGLFTVIAFHAVGKDIGKIKKDNMLRNGNISLHRICISIWVQIYED